MLGLILILVSEMDPSSPWALTKQHRVTHSATLGKYNAHLVIFMWKMSILTNLTYIYVLESISSQIETHFGFILCL